MAIDERKNGVNRMFIQISINDFIFLTAFQHSSECEHGKRKATVARPGGAWMKKNDQAFFLVLYILKREGSRLPRSFASSGLIAHCSPWLGEIFSHRIFSAF